MRIVLTTLCFVFSGMALAQNKKLVFVCEHGSAKSMIATAYFNKLAREKNLPWEAVSRGTNPDAEVSAKTKQLLESEQLMNPNLKPQKVSQYDVDSADQVVLFYELPADLRGEPNMQHWYNMNAVNGDFQKLRDDILSNVVNPLIDSLANQKKR